MQRSDYSLSQKRDYRVTAQGVADRVASQRCACSLLWSHHGVVECLECKTVYGILEVRQLRNGNSLLRWQLCLPGVDELPYEEHLIDTD